MISKKLMQKYERYQIAIDEATSTASLVDLKTGKELGFSDMIYRLIECDEMRAQRDEIADLGMALYWATEVQLSVLPEWLEKDRKALFEAVTKYGAGDRNEAG